MRRFTITTIFLFFLACLATTTGWAQSPHFIRASDAIITSGTDAGDLVLSWKEAGLGNNVTINYTASATNASATYACVNRGSNHPQASNKENVNGPVSASGAFNSGKNGSIDAGHRRGAGSWHFILSRWSIAGAGQCELRWRYDQR